MWLMRSCTRSALSGGWGPRPSGMEITFHARAPKGERIRSIRVNGNDVADAQLYTFGALRRLGAQAIRDGDHFPCKSAKGGTNPKHKSERKRCGCCAAV